MKLRVCTFNAHQRTGEASLVFLERRAQPNVVLLQEAKRAAWPGAMTPVERTEGRSQSWATAIWADETVLTDDLPKDPRRPGNLDTCRIDHGSPVDAGRRDADCRGQYLRRL
jgi:hypothetical protein